MFTGIIQGTAPLVAIEEKNNFRILYIKLPDIFLSDLTIGASVANNGCCLTVNDIVNNIVRFDLIQETIRITNLGRLKVGDEINLERAIRMNEEIGGHLMSGHILCTAEITKIYVSENNLQIWLKLSDKELMEYIIHKGYIGVDGISLTVGSVVDNEFCVNLIPITLKRTALGKKKLGDFVNIEIDQQIQVIVDTVKRTMSKIAGL